MGSCFIISFQIEVWGGGGERGGGGGGGGGGRRGGGGGGALALPALCRRIGKKKKIHDRRDFFAHGSTIGGSYQLLRFRRSAAGSRTMRVRSVLGCPLFSLGCEISTQDREIGEKVREILDRT
jgi:hypothetical protein